MPRLALGISGSGSFAKLNIFLVDYDSSVSPIFSHASRDASLCEFLSLEQEASLEVDSSGEWTSSDRKQCRSPIRLIGLVDDDRERFSEIVNLGSLGIARGTSQPTPNSQAFGAKSLRRNQIFPVVFLCFTRPRLELFSRSELQQERL